MKKKILAFMLVAALGGTSLLPVNAMEPSEAAVVEGVQGEEETEEDGAVEKETQEEPKKEQQVSEEEKKETPEQKEEEGKEGSEPIEENSDDQKGSEPSGERNTSEDGNVEEDQQDPGNEAGENEGPEDVEEGTEWRIDKSQIELQIGGKEYFCVSGIAESADRPQVAASDASGVSVSETTQSEAGAESTGGISSEGYWYEVTGLKSGDYVISVTAQETTREIAVHIAEPVETEGEESLVPDEGAAEKNEILEQADQAVLSAENASVEQGWSEDGLYYRNEAGELSKGIAEIEGVLYYFDEDTGKLCQEAQWISKDGAKYFCNAEGVLYQNQLIKFGTTYYYMGSDGSVQKGIVTTEDGTKYYADEESGSIRTSSWIEEDGKEYFADGTGKLYSNQFIKFGDTYYYMGSDGSVQKGIVKASDGKYYYTNEETGILEKKAGWLEKGGNTYYCNAQGMLYSNQFIKFGDIYYYCGSAAIVKSQTVPVNGVLYKFDADGVMVKEGGWGTYNGNRYYKNPATGFPYTGWVTFGSTWYYAGSNGLMVKGWQYISGKYYYFYPSTYVMARNTVIDGYVIGADGARVPTALSKMQQRTMGYSSSTSYLLMVDRAAHKVGVFRGSKGNWTNLYFWDCTTGAPSTPTVSGVFTVGIKGYYFDSGASRCFWYTQFYGNYLFHTVLCNKDGSIRDGRLGMSLSHGCVRLAISNAKWIYDNIPRGTTVVVY